MAIVGNTKVTPDTWDGAYPLPDLRIGDIWNGTYDNSSECVGFAKMVLDATMGAGDPIGYTKFTDANSVKNAFSTIKVGARITFDNRDNTYGEHHAVIISNHSSTGITVYDCNYSKTTHNIIGSRTWTWATLLNNFTGISSGVDHG